MLKNIPVCVLSLLQQKIDLLNVVSHNIIHYKNIT
jgi:hypothetical protein